MANKNISVGVKIEGDAKGFKTAAEDAKRASDKLKNSLDKNIKTSTGGFNGISKAITAMGAAAVAAAAVVGAALIKIGKESIMLAAKAQGVEIAFKALNDPNLLKELQEATRGTVDNVTLMQKAIQAKNFKIPLSELATYFKFATSRAIQTGESVDYLVDSIITGIGRKSTLVMDNLGISAVELQAEIKKTGDFAVAAGNIINRELEGMGDVADTTAIKFEALKTSWLNFKTALGEKLIDSAWFQGFMEKLDIFTEAITREKRPYQGASAEALFKTFTVKEEQINKIFNQLDSLEAKAGGKIEDLNKKDQRIYGKLIKEARELTEERKAIVAELEKIISAVPNKNNNIVVPFIKEKVNVPNVESPVGNWNINKSSFEGILMISKQYEDLDLAIKKATEANEKFLETFKEIPESGLTLQDQINLINDVEAGFRSMFEAVIAGSDASGSAFEKMGEAFKNMLTAMAAEMAAKAALFAILSVLFPGSSILKEMGSFGSFILKGFTTGGMNASAGIGQIGNNIGIGDKAMNINLNANLKGRDITLSNNRYNNTLIKNT